MPDIQYIPITNLGESVMLTLMEEEARMWLTDLGWDYSDIQRVLLSFIREKMLPGYVAFTGEKQPVGYLYFIANRAKGSIGALYTTPTTPTDLAQKTADGLLKLAIDCLQNSGGIRRIETQIFPFHGQNYTRIFGIHGFRHYPRLYLVKDIETDVIETDPAAPVKIIPWDSALIGPAAAMTAVCYLNHPDYEIIEDYHTPANCENYLRGLMTGPGCGVFLQDASFMCVNRHGIPCGHVICSRISDRGAQIPQIITHPEWQGRGLGAALMRRCLRQLKAMNFNFLSLVVTVKNTRAMEWYRRIGFRPCREFGAFIWDRPRVNADL